ncbi:EAL domain-containing protein [Vibrio sp. LaRot3]|uniref:EAL domain-containing protein n=1 Tax=Vibrio sp. LaRot3 TaxID=2998829 RepID=UPI0022CDF68C|nr:EAL domain-containing protein [Vibrio sp. LaRot3]MDA0148103.1 EAL domain-containing protein [Vibrio sp. LaRot3]
MKIKPLYSLLANISENAYINGLCNVFVMLLPVSLLSAFCMLIGHGFELLGYDWLGQKIILTSTLVWKLFPILLVVYFSQFLAGYERVSRANVITSSLLIYVIICHEWGMLQPGTVVPSNYPLAVLIPLFVSKTLALFTRKKLFLESDLPNVVDQTLNLVVSTIVLVFTYSMAGILLKSAVDWGIGAESLLPSLDTCSLSSALTYELLRNVLWSIGINGHIILSPYKSELYELTQQSFALHNELGTPLPIITSNFYDIYAGIGGAGNTLSLVLCMLLFTKNKAYRTLALAALTLSIFNINEPILFGLPIIFNPVLIVPFLLTPLIGLSLAYFVTASGLVLPVSSVISWMTPVFFSGYHATGGDEAAVVLQLAILLVGVAIYYPFFKQMDKVVGGNAIFTKGLSDNFFVYPQVAKRQEVVGLLPQMSANLSAQRHIAELQNNGEFVLFYQPQMDIRRGKVSSLEVLIRHKSNKGVITPPTFLSSFAKLGLTSEIDLWVVKQALEEVAPLTVNPDFKVSINISPDTFLVEGFADIVTNLIEQSCVDFSQVELEITEDLLIQDEQTTASVLARLQQLGISIALDDFGSGYSSIGYLSSYEFDKVKIDRSLVLNLKNKNGREMFSLTSQLVRVTGAEIVVEGVEHVNEMMFMREQNIELIQGYYFYKPMPLSEVIERKLFG